MKLKTQIQAGRGIHPARGSQGQGQGQDRGRGETLSCSSPIIKRGDKEMF